MPTRPDAPLPIFADLQRELPLASAALRTGYRHGFDSGSLMDHVYANRPRGRGVAGEPAAAAGYAPASVTADRFGISRVVRLVRAETSA
jgi:hypothetical protein